MGGLFSSKQSSSSSYSQNTKREPWSPAASILKGQVLPQASNLLGGIQNVPSRFYKSPSSDMLMNIRNRANAQSGGFNDVQNMLLKQAQQGSPTYSRDASAKTFLEGVVNNQGGINPNIRKALDYALADVGAAQNTAFSSAGRYGSGAHAGALARETGRLSANTLSEAYERERDRKMSASDLLERHGLGAFGANLEGQRQGIANARGYSDMNNEAIRNLLYGAEADKQIGMYEQLGRDNTFQNQMNQYMMPQQSLGGLGGLLANIAQLGGTSETEGKSKTTSKSTPSLFDSIAKLATGAFSAYTGFGGFGNMGATGTNMNAFSSLLPQGGVIPSQIYRDY